MSIQPYQTPPSAVVPQDQAKRRGGPSPFVKVLPFALNTAAAVLAHQWHYQGGAHSIGDAALTCTAAAAALWSGYRLSAGRLVPSIALAATYGTGGALIGVAVINYTTAIAAALLAWLAGNIVSYVLLATGWTKRADRREERTHEKEMLQIRESGKTERTRIKADAQVAVARELAGAWAAEQAARGDFNARYPSSVPLVEQIHIRPEVRAGWDVDSELRMLTEAPRRELPPPADQDGIDLPAWLGEQHRRDAR
jgi:hypothetical protein